MPVTDIAEHTTAVTALRAHTVTAVKRKTTKAKIT